MQRSVPVPVLGRCCGSSSLSVSPPLADDPGLGPQPRWWTWSFINTFPPCFPSRVCLLSGPSPHSQRLFATHLLPRLCPSFIHSFHRAVLTFTFDEKDNSHHPRSYQPHFGNGKRTIPTSGLTRKHPGSKTKTTHTRDTFQCSQPTLFGSSTYHLHSTCQQGASEAHPTLFA